MCSEKVNCPETVHSEPVSMRHFPSASDMFEIFETSQRGSLGLNRAALCDRSFTLLLFMWTGVFESDQVTAELSASSQVFMELHTRRRVQLRLPPIKPLAVN